MSDSTSLKISFMLGSFLWPWSCHWLVSMYIYLQKTLWHFCGSCVNLCYTLLLMSWCSNRFNPGHRDKPIIVKTLDNFYSVHFQNWQDTKVTALVLVVIVWLRLWSVSFLHLTELMMNSWPQQCKLIVFLAFLKKNNLLDYVFCGIAAW